MEMPNSHAVVIGKGLPSALKAKIARGANGVVTVSSPTPYSLTRIGAHENGKAASRLRKKNGAGNRTDRTLESAQAEWVGYNQRDASRYLAKAYRVVETTSREPLSRGAARIDEALRELNHMKQRRRSESRHGLAATPVGAVAGAGAGFAAARKLGASPKRWAAYGAGYGVFGSALVGGKIGQKRYDRSLIKPQASPSKDSFRKADDVADLPIPEWARNAWSMAPVRIVDPLDMYAGSAMVAEGYRKVAGKRLMPWQRKKVKAGGLEMAQGRAMMYSPLGSGRSQA